MRINKRDWLKGSAAAAGILAGVKGALPQGEALDGDRLPFSRFGSYWAVSKRWEFGASTEIPAGAWYIRLLEDDVSPNELFRLEMEGGARKIPFQARLTPAELTLSGDSGASVRFVVAAPDVLRVRGQGCSLRLDGIKGAYGYAVQHSPRAWEMLASVDMPRVEVRALRGTLAVDAA